MSNPPQRLQRHTVIECPECGAAHQFALLVRQPDEPLLFAGPGRTKAVEIELTCPRTGEEFPEPVEIGPDEALVGVADPFNEHPSQESAMNSDPVAGSDAEYAEWARTSRERGLDYCRTMLTTSTAAIPVHFTMLEFLGPLHDGRSAAILAFAPAVAFLAASTGFALAQRPKLLTANHGSFGNIRAMALRHINRFANWGTTLFLGATAGALAVYASLLLD